MRRVVHIQVRAYRRLCIHKAVHTQGGAHKRRSVVTARVLLFKWPQAAWYTSKAMHRKGGW